MTKTRLRFLGFALFGLFLAAEAMYIFRLPTSYERISNSLETIFVVSVTVAIESFIRRLKGEGKQDKDHVDNDTK